jgi:uncharacterized protein (DUF305 family)
MRCMGLIAVLLATGFGFAAGHFVGDKHASVETLLELCFGKSDAALNELKSVMGEMHSAIMETAAADTVEDNFVNLMIPHHRAAIEAGQVLLRRSSDKTLRLLTQDIVESQTTEIMIMEDWLKKRNTWRKASS